MPLKAPFQEEFYGILICLGCAINMGTIHYFRKNDRLEQMISLVFPKFSYYVKTLVHLV